MAGPMKITATMTKNDSLLKAANLIDTFINGMKDMVGVFADEYEGGDFCKGLIFGRDGASMLFEIAQTFVDEDERHQYQVDKKRSESKKAVDKVKTTNGSKTDKIENVNAERNQKRSTRQ